MSEASTETIKPDSTVIISGGGTGGHIFPALAVANKLNEYTNGRLKCHFIGNANRMEAEQAPKAGLAFSGIEFSGMPRGGILLPFRLLDWGFQWFKATLLVLELYKAHKPVAIFATGGYVTAPVILAGLLSRIPVFIHEPDAVPGRVNRLFAKWITKATVAFESAASHFPNGNVEVTGNPVRQGLASLPSAVEGYQQWFHDGMMKPPVRPVLLVMGGSLGSRSINNAVLGCLPSLINDCGLAVIHQVGQKPWEQFEYDYKTALAEMDEATRLACQHYYRPVAFIDKMPEALACATLAVCRSGSMTLSELGVAWLPALLVPYPHAAANHQWHNAEACVKQGKAHIVADEKLTPEHLLLEIEHLLKPQRLKAMRQTMLENPYPINAADKIAQNIIQTIGQ